MNTDRDPKWKGEQYNKRRSYSRNPGSRNQYKPQNHAGYNMNEDAQASDNGPGVNSNELIQSFHSPTVENSNQPRQNDHRNFNRRSYSDHPDSCVDPIPKTPSQRGQILGGRYIRQQAHSRSYRNVNAGAQKNSYSSHKYGNSSNSYSSGKSQSDSTYNKNIESGSNESSHSSSYQDREYNSKKYDSSNESVASHNTSYQPRQYNSKKYDNANESVTSHSTSYQFREYNNKKLDSSNLPVASYSASYNSREYNNKKYDSSNEQKDSHSTLYQPREHNSKKYDNFNNSATSHSASYNPKEYNVKKYDSSYEPKASHSTSYSFYNTKKYGSSNEPTASHSASYKSKDYNSKKYDDSDNLPAFHGASCNSKDYNSIKYDSSSSTSYNSRERNSKKYDSSTESAASHSALYYNRKYGKKYESSSSEYQDPGSASNANNLRDEASKGKSRKDEENNATQRELLISHLNKGECECLVCCEPIRTRDQIWHCLSCFHVFHLRCIKKWARSPHAAVKDGSWRCPACQSLSSEVPFHYYCFCGAKKNPEINYHLTPHSCGEICDRSRRDCPHHCKELCHPGPCPPCVVVVQKTCPCGKTKQTLPCNQSMETSCQYVCEKLLNCKFHKCQSKCHEGDCLPCEDIVQQKCYCGKCEQYTACTKETASCFDYSCGDVCNRTLGCGRHVCISVCHPDDCKPCSLSPEAIQSCCCGKSTLDQLVLSGKAQKRTSCEDPVPVCDMVCGKTLFCGPKENPHTCQSLCHAADCPPCPLSTSVKCSCGAFGKDFPCAEIMPSFNYKCEKRCNRRKDCGRHKCLNNCCTNTEHKCDLICNKKLSCGLHLCQDMCHMGNCPTCWNVSFDELRCYCGTSVLYPPIPCGTRPPECPNPCTRDHPCDHDVKHTCHSDNVCPPCTSLTTKWCYGKHKQCGPVMCFLDGVSCGMPCQKPLPCGRHKCRSTCHDGECLKESKCTQPCSVPRPSCGHPCGIPCHDGTCVETPCKAQVTSNCPCGRRSETTTCFDSSKSYRLMSSTILATKMQEIKEGQSVNLNDVLGKKSKNSKLQCNEECAVIERNKRLALALQIQNPDLSCSPGPPSYSEFLKEEAKKNPHFVADVYDKLSSLVQLATESKHKNRRHAFPPMNRDQRRVVHELAEFFGCETLSYDDEPKRNVVATAVKNKCWLPFTSIMSVVQRDMGIRKGPAPVIAQRDPKSAPPGGSASTTQKKKIDYFDYNQ